jgi:hypothetical protein
LARWDGIPSREKSVADGVDPITIKYYKLRVKMCQEQNAALGPVVLLLF